MKGVQNKIRYVFDHSQIGSKGVVYKNAGLFY